jgi:hypothetical protein
LLLLLMLLLLSSALNLFLSLLCCCWPFAVIGAVLAWFVATAFVVCSAICANVSILQVLPPCNASAATAHKLSALVKIH